VKIKGSLVQDVNHNNLARKKTNKSARKIEMIPF